MISWKSSAVEFLGWLELIFSDRDVVDQRVLSVLSKDSGLLCTDVLCSKISKMGKKMVANCMTMMPGASHMGGTNHGLTGLKYVVKTAAIQRGEPGSLRSQLGT